MKIQVKNLGVIKEAEFEVGDLTILCGSNNTGKTYLTYALYGFLDYWKEGFSLTIPKELIAMLKQKGTVTLSVDQYIKDAKAQIQRASNQFSNPQIFATVFASKEIYFLKSQFSIEIKNTFSPSLEEIEMVYGSLEKKFLKIKKKSENEIEITLLIEKNSFAEIPSTRILNEMISDAIKNSVFSKILPRVFISTIERTGSAIFQKELDFTRNRVVDLLGDKSTKFSPMKLLGKFSSGYPIPVRKNVDFIRELPGLFNRESFILKIYPEILTEFSSINGGEYKVTKDGDLLYIPKSARRIRLSMGESSSSVLSLLDMGFYLRYVIQHGDLLIVDEPELNLHPENQRRVARLLARLVNIGIKVFITTHSDYIIKELNTLIMLNHDKPHLNRICTKEGYKKEELLAADKIRVYMTKNNGKNNYTLEAANIDQELGIEVKTFDTTIDDMNRIQEAIVWGGE